MTSHTDDSKYLHFCFDLEALTHVPKGRPVRNFHILDDVSREVLASRGFQHCHRFFHFR